MWFLCLWWLCVVCETTGVGSETKNARSKLQNNPQFKNFIPGLDERQGSWARRHIKTLKGFSSPTRLYKNGA
ncbi:hypothetical protein B0H65DRAFT_457618 [Neurospora tetraspora]|uniref:Secreted protein n=1 Tax=Neurospora tetraspora TaxID=94610 RepID=A0AAE0JKC9_9PEZI|nr:hypothetical protein B0H65DRAFT_457618 [Neurospora tetraspora]